MLALLALAWGAVYLVLEIRLELARRRHLAGGAADGRRAVRNLEPGDADRVLLEDPGGNKTRVQDRARDRRVRLHLR